MKNKILPIISIVILIAAVGVFMYPTISQWINAMLCESAVTQYNNTTDALSAEDKAELLAQADEYNRGLSQPVGDSFSSTAFTVDEEYLSILDITENGQIGVIEIPSIDCSLPIYHSGGEDMLTKGAVHLAGTSFPIGGISTHSVISAHTAYPGKLFFDNLTEVKIGDEFSVTVLGDTLYYKCIDISVVLPSDTSLLGIEEGKDLITLVTCTPYSINTHRLLVTGERIEKASEVISTDDEAVTEYHTVHHAATDIVPVLIVAGVVIIAVIILIWRKSRKAHEK